MIRAAFLALALIASPAAAQVVTVPVSTVDAIARSAAAAAQASADASVKSVNTITPTAGAVTVPLPTASTTIPPCVADAGAAGTAGTMQFAPFNHTHCSKVRRGRSTSATDGSLSTTFSPAFSNPPICVAVAEVAAGVTDVVNVQIVGTPTTTSASFLVNRTNRSVVALIGLTVLSVPSSPGATAVHWACIEP